MAVKHECSTTCEMLHTGESCSAAFFFLNADMRSILMFYYIPRVQRHHVATAHFEQCRPIVEMYVCMSQCICVYVYMCICACKVCSLGLLFIFFEGEGWAGRKEGGKGFVT